MYCWRIENFNYKMIANYLYDYSLLITYLIVVVTDSTKSERLYLCTKMNGIWSTISLELKNNNVDTEIVLYLDFVISIK